MPPPNEASGSGQQPPRYFSLLWRLSNQNPLTHDSSHFPPLQAQNVGQGLQPTPRYYFNNGKLYIDRFAPPRPMSEMSGRSLNSEVSERDLDEEEAECRRKVASGQAD